MIALQLLRKQRVWWSSFCLREGTASPKSFLNRRLPEPSLPCDGIRCLNFAGARLEKTRFAPFMKTSIFRIVPLPTEVAEAARRTVKTGVADHALVTVNSPRSFPCRHCLRWDPADFRNGRVFRAYGSNYNIIDAQIVDGREPELVIQELFENPETAFVDVRSVTHGCFTFRVQRA